MHVKAGGPKRLTRALGEDKEEGSSGHVYQEYKMFALSFSMNKLFTGQENRHHGNMYNSDILTHPARFSSEIRPRADVLFRSQIHLCLLAFSGPS